MKNREEIEKKIQNEEDFIHYPRLGNSLKRFVDANPNGVDEERMAKVLLMPVDSIKKHYEAAIRKIRRMVGE